LRGWDWVKPARRNSFDPLFASAFTPAAAAFGIIAAAKAARVNCQSGAGVVSVGFASKSSRATTRALRWRKKRRSIFAAGAREVWFCAVNGRMTFFVGASARGQKASKFCPAFPREVQL